MDEQFIKHNVGKKIKKYRQSLNLPQFKLGELIDINQRQIAQIELGKSFPSLTTLLKMSEVFQCSLSDFFEGNEYNNEEILKAEMKSMIDKANYEDCKRLYAVMKSFIFI